MCVFDPDLKDYEGTTMEDAWYELEGAYEVYGIGRNRFVLSHCRTAMFIAIALLVKKRGGSPTDVGFEPLGKELGMPDDLIGSCMDIDRAGRYLNILKKEKDEQELAAIVLSKTLEAFEWIRGNLGTD